MKSHSFSAVRSAGSRARFPAESHSLAGPARYSPAAAVNTPSPLPQGRGQGEGKSPSLVASGFPHRPGPRPESGMALVITLILLAVITFMAVTFLAVARREKGSVTVTAEQKVATLASETAVERATAEITAAIIAKQNPAEIGLLVSTNFINRAGFNPNAIPHPDGNPTNVNYDYRIDGTPGLTPGSGNQAQQNLANLLFNPRPPVFVTNRAAANSMDFRFYVDLNRNGRFDPTGLLIVTNQFGGFYRPNGTLYPIESISPTNYWRNDLLHDYFTGDPQYIGILERPEFPHSPSNRFVGRYAYIVVPAGKTLDVNYIHNYAKQLNVPMSYGSPDGFRRNQGVGSWENNLASFFVDLNTNIWPGPNQGGYRYDPDGMTTGVAADDALSFLRYRYTYGIPGGYRNLFPAGNVAGSSFDGIDAYGRAALMTNRYGLLQEGDLGGAMPWQGSENTNHLFTVQDFFNTSKVEYHFSQRLTNAPLFSPSSYDRYTYYRMLAQLGTDSVPDANDKVNVNFVNYGHIHLTNYYFWTDKALEQAPPVGYGRRGSEVFFTNAVDGLLKRYSAEWLARDSNSYFLNFGTNRTFSAGSIPVFVNNRFAYTPSIHRILQVSANIFDAANPRIYNGNTNILPTFFRPVFQLVNNDIYIKDYREVTVDSEVNFDQLINIAPLDITLTNGLQALRTAIQSDPEQINNAILVYGVPLVVGAVKGLPNFNEFASENVVQVTRKLKLYKASAESSVITKINQMYVVGISNGIGAEFWNSYEKSFGTVAQPVDVVISNRMSIALTNDTKYPGLFSTVVLGGRQRVPAAATKLPTTWVQYNKSTIDNSFVVPFSTNFIVIPDMAYSDRDAIFKGLTEQFEDTPQAPVPFPVPRWGFVVTNRITAYVRDISSRRLLDFVILSPLVGYRAITEDMSQSATGGGNDFKKVWSTNSPDGVHLSGKPGVDYQIAISRGEYLSGSDSWNNYLFSPYTVPAKLNEIAKFNSFMTGKPQTYSEGELTSEKANYTGTEAVTPFSPSWKQSLSLRWQANDPLVHYTAGDLEDARSGMVLNWTPPGSETNTMESIGQLNKNYRPWGGAGGNLLGASVTDKDAYNWAMRDPGVTSSDKWIFPTNRLPTVGWLGRVHRGTPWQTIYMKSKPVTDVANWGRNWTGNRNGFDATNTFPQNDRLIFDVFSTALNENASRGQLSVNQTNLAAWSAVFGGIPTLTNITSDEDLLAQNAGAIGPQIIESAGVYNPFVINPDRTVARLVSAIIHTKTNVNLFPKQTFKSAGDILAVPELSDQSILLNLGNLDDAGDNAQRQIALNDTLYEWLPQQMMSLVKLGEPRFVVYTYGQALKPADQAVITSSPYFNMVTNYQVTAEVVSRAVVRIEGAPGNPRAVVESFNVLPPD